MAAGDKFELFEKKMRAEGLSEAAIDAFRYNYQQLVEGVTGMVRQVCRAPRLLPRLSTEPGRR